MSLYARQKATSSSSNAVKSKTRLFVSNLAPGVTDAVLATLFKPFGSITSLSLIFHTIGPQKGHSKGYAFVEYSKEEDAQKARSTIDGRTLAGKEVRIGFANVQEPPSGGVGPHRHTRREDHSRPTTLSLMKNAGRPSSTSAKIAVMEAKLAAIRAKNEQAEGSTSSSAGPSGSNKLLAPEAIKKAGLPSKPPPSTSR